MKWNIGVIPSTMSWRVRYGKDICFMKDLEQAQILLTAAQRDLSALAGMDDATVFADEIFGFLVQQAAEKLFKAWLTLLGETYPATHNLARLLEMLSAHDTSAERFNDLTEFTPFAVQFRYSLPDTDAMSLNRVSAVRRVNALFKEVLGWAEDMKEAARES